MRSICSAWLLLVLVGAALPAVAGGAEHLPPATDDPHAALACNSCHQNAGEPAGAEGTVSATSCRDCHDDRREPHLGGLGYLAGDRRDCTGCHSFHEPGRLSTAVGPVDLSGASTTEVAGHCRSCHEVGADLAALGDAHRAAARLYHTEATELKGSSPSQGCLNCHDRASDSLWPRANGDARLTFHLHATHPLGVVVEPGSGEDARRIRKQIDVRLPLFDRRIECQTCHALTAGTRDLLIPFPTAKELCLGCHQFKDDTEVPPQALMATIGAAPSR